jgi:Flp pilus assembly protein TadD
MRFATASRIIFALTAAITASACGDEARQLRIEEAAPTVANAIGAGTGFGGAARARDLVPAPAIEVRSVSVPPDGERPETHLELARSFLTSGDRKQALAAARKAVKLAGSSSAAWNTLGRAQLAYHNYDDAITAFERAVELNPENAFAWNNLGFTLNTLELWDEAARALEAATASAEVTGYMWNNLGVAYEHLDRLDEARRAYERGAASGSQVAAHSRVRLEGVDTIVREQIAARPSEVLDAHGLVDEVEVVEEALRAEEVETDHGEAEEQTDEAVGEDEDGSDGEVVPVSPPGGGSALDPTSSTVVDQEGC